MKSVGEIAKSIDCSVCGGHEHVFIKEIIGSSWYMCKKCLLIYRKPVDDVVEDRTHNIWYQWGQSQAQTKEQYEARVVGLGRAWEDFYSKAGSPNVQAVLDIGSGDGPLLEYLSRKGIAATGVELSIINSQFSRDRGHSVHTGGLESALFENESFDVVNFCNSAQHIINLSEVLSTSHDLLRENGLIFISTKGYENTTNVFSRSLSNDSERGPIYLFSSNSLYNSLALAGFKVCYLKKNWSDYFIIARKTNKGSVTLKGSWQLQKLFFYVHWKLQPVCSACHQMTSKVIETLVRVRDALRTCRK